MHSKRLVSVLLAFLLCSYSIALIGEYFVPEAFAQEPPVTVSVFPDISVFEKTQIFSINLTISYVEQLSAWQVNLKFDSSILSAGTITPGPRFTTASFFPTIEANNVAIACLFGSGYSVDDPGVLATITFTVMANGKSNLHLHDIVLRHPGGVDIPQDPPLDGVFYTQTPRASFYSLPSTTAGTPGYLIPSYLIRDPIVGELITFNASFYTTYGFYAGSYDPDGGSIESYRWDFGDGNITTLSNPTVTHSYAVRGLHPVNLTVTDNDTRTDSYEAIVNVAKRDVAISGITVSPAVASPGERILIQVNITNLGFNTEFVNVTLYYDNTLIWYNQTEGKGAYSSPLQLEVDPTHPPDLRRVIFDPGRSIPLNYTWETTGVPLGSHTIHANISLVWQNATIFLKDFYQKELDYNITNNEKVWDGTVDINIIPNIAVTDIKLTPTLQLPNIISHGQTPVSVGITVKNTGDSDETFNVTLYGNSTLLRNWIDVTLLSNTQTTLTYAWDPSTLARGLYILTAQASNVTDEVKNGRTGDNKLTFKVTITSAPTAIFIYSPTKPIVGSTISFNATGSSAAEGWAITGYKWIFNGTIDQSFTDRTAASRTYQSRGNYNITLTVTDGAGLTASVSHIIHVGIPPASQFTYTPSAPKADETIAFNASLSTADAGTSTNLDTIVSYRWNLNDGTKLFFTEANLTKTFTHSFAKSGNFSATLTVVDGEGFNNTITKFVLVSKIASSLSMTVSTQTIQAGQSLTISGQVTPPHSGAQITILYKLGTGDWATLPANIVSDQSGNYQYAWIVNTAGNYTVKTRVGSDDKFSGADSKTSTFEVEESSPPPPPSQPLDLTPYILGGVIILIIIGVGVYLMRRRK